LAGHSLRPGSACALQHRALLYGLAGPTPRVEQIHARPIAETAILIDYIADEPDVRVWEWVAQGPRKQRTLFTGWLKAVERGDDSSASPEALTELIARKAAEIVEFEKQAKDAAAARGRELHKVSLPSVEEQAKRKPHLLILYTQVFRHLSNSSVHVASTLFTEDRYGDAKSPLDDSLAAEDRLAIRAISTTTLASVYYDAAQALGRDDLAARAEALAEAVIKS
jgi:hypothetical protein